jgi:signal peptidase I
MPAPGRAIPAAAIGLAGLGLAGLAWLARRNIAIVDVVGESMLPTLSSGDRVLVRRAGIGQLRPGAVVVVEKPARDGSWIMPLSRWPAGERELMIKRVAAVPGDRCPDVLPGAAAVPAGQFAVIGDNPARSYDSRQLGYFPAERLIGVVIGQLRRG